MASKKRLTADERAIKKNHERWTALAVCLGFNELAKLGESLGEKVYARLLRDKHLENFVRLGGNADLFKREPAVCEIVMPERMPNVTFRAEDIELMRKAVAEHDADPSVVDKCARGTCEKPALKGRHYCSDECWAIEDPEVRPEGWQMPSDAKGGG